MQRGLSGDRDQDHLWGVALASEWWPRSAVGLSRRLSAVSATGPVGADSDGSRPPIPTRSRPAFRFDAGHHSEMKPATR